MAECSRAIWLRLSERRLLCIPPLMKTLFPGPVAAKRQKIPRTGLFCRTIHGFYFRKNVNLRKITLRNPFRCLESLLAEHMCLPRRFVLDFTSAHSLLAFYHESHPPFPPSTFVCRCAATGRFGLQCLQQAPSRMEHRCVAMQR